MPGLSRYHPHAAVDGERLTRYASFAARLCCVVFTPPAIPRPQPAAEFLTGFLRQQFRIVDLGGDEVDAGNRRAASRYCVGTGGDAAGPCDRRRWRRCVVVAAAAITASG